ncbi:MAG: DUF4097 family beta strand repeat protein [Oscillospiraceae bacterium]|nr:DUF4097 family beta strand repeat protein [Oscillospiraceae bacterium]
MKTWKKIVLLIGILLLAFGLTVLQIAHHRGDSFGFGTPSFGFGSSGSFDYDQKGYTVCTDGEESFSAKDVRALHIDWLSGAVSVERYDGKDVVVREKASARLSEDQCMRFRLSGGTLSILPCANRVGNLPEKQLTVLVPQSLTPSEAAADATSASVTMRGLDVAGEIRLSSLSGSLHAEDCSCTSLQLDSSSGSQSILRCEVIGGVDADSLSGSFTAEELSCLSLAVESSSGSHKISALSCGELKLSSTSGSQRASGLDCRSADCSSTSGSVQLSFAAEPESVKVESTSGSVELTFPKGTGVDLVFDSSSGSLHGDKSRVRGGIPVDVETTSGSLTIRYQ